jgi:hypothetical protein
VLARLARVFLLVALLAGWQAALAHSIEHGTGSHQETTLCGALDALTACADKCGTPHAEQARAADLYIPRVPSTRAADAPPFHSQAPPAASS